MSKPMKSFYEATRYLGQYIGQDVKFLFDTSCMGSNRRVQIAVLTWFLEDVGEKDLTKMKTKELLTKIILPLLEKLGHAEWIRDTVTDMAIRKGMKTEGDVWDVSKDEEKE